MRAAAVGAVCVVGATACGGGAAATLPEAADIRVSGSQSIEVPRYHNGAKSPTLTSIKGQGWTVQVVDAKGDSVMGSKVRFLDSDGDEIREVRTDANGEARLTLGQFLRERDFSDEHVGHGVWIPGGKDLERWKNDNYDGDVKIAGYANAQREPVGIRAEVKVQRANGKIGRESVTLRVNYTGAPLSPTGTYLPSR